MADIDQAEATRAKFCENYIMATNAVISVRDKIARALKLIKHPTQILGAAAAAITDLAASIVAGAIASAGAAVAGAAAAILQQIFELILEILLAGPEALASIMAIPLRKAKRAAQDEIAALTAAQQNLDSIFSILNKWLGGFGGDEYIDRIKQTIPLINEAVHYIGNMKDDLKGSPAFFDENKYNVIIGDISQAIDITKPTPIIYELAGIDQKSDLNIAAAIESRRINKLNEYLDTIDVWYAGEKDRIDKKRSDAISAAFAAFPSDNKNIITNRMTTPGITGAVANLSAGKPEEAKRALAVSKAESTYIADIEKIDADKNYRIQAANVKSRIWSESASPLNGNNLKKTGKAIGSAISDAFLQDMNSLKAALQDLGTSIITAYAMNKKSQIYTNAAYKAKDLIQAMLRFFIGAAYYAGKASAPVASAALESARVILSKVANKTNNGMYDKQIKNYQNNEQFLLQ